VSDLRTRLNQLAEQLVEGATVPAPAAIRHRGRRRQRRTVVLGAAAVLAVAAAVPGVLDVRQQEPLEPRGERTVAVITIPDRLLPAGLAVGAGSLWVGGGFRGVVYRVDPATNRVVATIPLTAVRVQDVAFGAGALWAVSPGGQLMKIDPASNRQVRFGYVDPRAETVSVGASGLRFGFGSLWVVLDARLVVRIDPATWKATRIPAPGAYGGSMAVGEGGVWVGKLASPPTREGSDSVMLVDPASNRVVGTLGVGANRCCGVAAAGGSVWMTSSASSAAGAAVRRIDPATRRTVATIRLGSDLGAVGVAGDSLWVADDRATRLWRIDARTNEVLGTVTLDRVAGARASSPLVGSPDGTVWVLHSEEGKLLRVAPRG
jgi:DNA-binding beta-propeller fold protein YncE